MQSLQSMVESKQLYRTNSNKPTTNSIELPAEIDALIDNKMYQNKYRKMIREGHLKALLELAAIAVTKKTPSRWFATVCSKARWAGTLKWLQKLQEVVVTAAEITKRLTVPPAQLKAVYKACWKRSDALRQAVKAVETGHNPRSYFFWLCFKT